MNTTISKPIWEDITVYSPDEDPAKRVSSTWVLTIPGELTIFVARHAELPPDVWALACHRLKIHGHPLFSKDISNAKEEALRLVTYRCQCEAAVWSQRYKALLEI